MKRLRDRYELARLRVRELGYARSLRRSVKWDAFWAGFRASCMGRRMPAGLGQSERGAWKRGYGV